MREVLVLGGRDLAAPLAGGALRAMSPLRPNVAYEWAVEWKDGRVTTVLAHNREQAERIARRKHPRPGGVAILAARLIF